LKFVSLDLDNMTEVVVCILELIFIVEAPIIPILYTEYALSLFVLMDYALQSGSSVKASFIILL